MSRPASSNGVGGVGSPRAASASAARKVAHTSEQHARFLEAPPSPRTQTMDDPFSVYLHKLKLLQTASAKGTLAAHHLVIDCVRVLEDVLVQAAQTFLVQRTPPTLLALSVEHAQTQVLERLRDAEVISPAVDRQIGDARKLARWVLVSSAREVPAETAANLLALVTKLASQFLSDVTQAAEAKPRSGCSSGHAFCRDMEPAHLDVVGGPHNAHTIPPSRSATAPVAVDVNAPSNGTAPALPSPTTAGGLANPNGKVLKPKPRAHGALPYGWDQATFEAHCAPLHNTAHLDLQALEDEEEATEAEEIASREAERAEKIRLREEAAERRRERREAEEARRAATKAAAAGDLSDLDENPEEVDSEEERLTARRKSAREAAGEGAANGSGNSYDEEEENEDDENDDSSDDEEGTKAAARAERKAAVAARKAAEAEDEKVASEPIAAVAPAKSRFVFTFCCIACHSVLLRARDIDRINGNLVWSRPGKNLHGKSLLKNPADVWTSRPADERDKSASADGDEEEEEEAAADEDDEALGGSTNALEVAAKDEGASQREESTGVHCAGCHVYVGRFFPAKDAFRLIYIHRATGQNFMYHTGAAGVERLRPALLRKSDEEEEEEAERLAAEEEQASDEEDAEFLARRAAQTAARANQPVQPVRGLPFEYVDDRQAAQFPFPRFGPCTPYNQPAGWQLAHALLTDAERAAAMLRAAAPSEESKENGAVPPATAALGLGLTGLAGGRAAGAAATKCNSKTFRPTVPPVPTVHSMLRRAADSAYALPPAETVASDPSAAAALTADLGVLLWTDRVFHNRRALDRVTARICDLFRSFPSGVYANMKAPPVPLFTHFFTQQPDFTHCRGTARYVFHFLTKKDDSKIKRITYTHKKFLKSLSRHENSVTHLSAGGYGGHRVVLVKVGLAFRVFQSNHSLDVATDRFTCLQWLASDYPWSRTLGLGEVVAFLAKFEEARRGSRAVWEELFTQGRRAMGLFDVSDEWQPEQVNFACAKLQDFAIQF